MTTVTCCKCHDILKENHVFNLQQDQRFCLQSTWNASNVNMTEFCGAYTLVENFNMRDFAAIAFPRKFNFKQYQLTLFSICDMDMQNPTGFVTSFNPYFIVLILKWFFHDYQLWNPYNIGAVFAMVCKIHLPKISDKWGLSTRYYIRSVLH